MKKLLALVLALVMSMSLVTISNADFKDADKISNKEAVDVMAAVGVLAGYDNGEFGATDTLTRAQACKIIAYLDLGKDVAEALPAVKVFSDVPASHWAAKYVAYCADAGYVSGVGDGKFAPDEKVTGYQFGKMLLCALGYDQKIEEMTGASWEIKVAKLMEKNSLSKGTSKLGSAALTREEAAQYGLNALKADMVEYEDKGTNITIGDTTISAGAKKAQAVTGVDTKYSKISDDGVVAPVSATNPYTVQLGEKLYNGKLVLTGSKYNWNTAEFGRPTFTWAYDGKTVGTYTAATPVLTYSGAVKEKTLFADLGLDGTTVTMKETYTNGTAAGSVSTITKGDNTDIAGTGNGVIVEVYETAVAREYRMVLVQQYIGKVSGVVKANANTDTKRSISVTVSGGTNFTGFETEEFAKNDWVIVTEVGSTGKTVAAAKKLENVAVTSYNSTSVTADGVTYKYSENVVDKPASYDMKAGNTYNFYLDTTGYVIKVETYSAANSDYLYVYDKGAAANTIGDFGSDKYVAVKYVKADGTKNTAKISKVGDTGVAAVNDISMGWATLTEDKDNDGYYKIKYVAAYDSANAATVGYKAVTNDYELDKTKATVGNTDAVAVNNKTVFILNDDGTMKVYNGLSEVPSYKDTNKITTASAALVKNGYATLVYINVTGKNASNAVDELFYIFKLDSVKYNSSKDSYYAVYKVLGDTELLTTTSAVVPTGLAKVTARNADGYATSLTAISTTGKYFAKTDLVSGDKIAFSDGVLSITDTSASSTDTIVVASDAVVYMIDSDDKVTESTADALDGDIDAASSIYVIYDSADNKVAKTIYFDGSIN